MVDVYDFDEQVLDDGGDGIEPEAFKLILLPLSNAATEIYFWSA